MPLDVASRAYVVPAGVDADTLLAFLADRFDVAADQPVSADSTVYDTVDRRLRAAGVEARREGGGAKARLVLLEGAGAPPVVAPLDGPVRDRYLAPELPEGPLRDRLAPLLEERALLPLVELRTVSRSVRVRNQDEKTVVRLTLSTPAVVAVPDPAQAYTGGPRRAPDGPITLSTRVTVTGVLGYPRPLARVDEALAGELGLQEALRPLADEAIVALDGDPSGLGGSKVSTQLAADQRTDLAAVAVLRDLADITEANIPGTLADLDTEFLHDLRVSVRKARSALREMKRAFVPDELEPQRATLKWVQAITGDTRDLDLWVLEETAWTNLCRKLGVLYIVTDHDGHWGMQVRSGMPDEASLTRPVTVPMVCAATGAAQHAAIHTAAPALRIAST